MAVPSATAWHTTATTAANVVAAAFMLLLISNSNCSSRCSHASMTHPAAWLWFSAYRCSNDATTTPAAFPNQTSTWRQHHQVLQSYKDDYDDEVLPSPRIVIIKSARTDWDDNSHRHHRLREEKESKENVRKGTVAGLSTLVMGGPSQVYHFTHHDVLNQRQYSEGGVVAVEGVEENEQGRRRFVLSVSPSSNVTKEDPDSSNEIVLYLEERAVNSSGIPPNPIVFSISLTLNHKGVLTATKAATATTTRASSTNSKTMSHQQGIMYGSAARYDTSTNQPFFLIGKILKNDDDEYVAIADPFPITPIFPSSSSASSAGFASSTSLRSRATPITHSGADRAHPDHGTSDVTRKRHHQDRRVLLRGGGSSIVDAEKAIALRSDAERACAEWDGAIKQDCIMDIVRSGEVAMAEVAVF